MTEDEANKQLKEKGCENMTEDEANKQLKEKGMVACADADAIRLFGIPEAEIRNGEIIWPTIEEMAQSLTASRGMRGRSVIGISWMKAYPEQRTLGRIGAPYITMIPLDWIGTAKAEEVLAEAKRIGKI